jgi:hypothetical protein
LAGIERDLDIAAAGGDAAKLAANIGRKHLDQNLVLDETRQHGGDLSVEQADVRLVQNAGDFDFATLEQTAAEAALPFQGHDVAAALVADTQGYSVAFKIGIRRIDIDAAQALGAAGRFAAQRRPLLGGFEAGIGGEEFQFEFMAVSSDRRCAYRYGCRYGAGRCRKILFQFRTCL